MKDDLPVPWKLQILERELRGIAIESPGPREQLFALADQLAAIRCPHCKMPAPALIRSQRRFRPAVAIPSLSTARILAFVVALVLFAVLAAWQWRMGEMLTRSLDTFATQQRQADAERHEQMILELRRIRSGATPKANSEFTPVKKPGEK